MDYGPERGMRAYCGLLGMTCRLWGGGAEFVLVQHTYVPGFTQVSIVHKSNCQVCI